MLRPLTDKDFRRAALLTVEDLAPMDNVTDRLADPHLFEGDINEVVVRKPIEPTNARSDSLDRPQRCS